MSALVAGFATSDPELNRLLSIMANAHIAPDVAAMCVLPSGATDFWLISSELEKVLQSMASAHSPPSTPDSLRAVVHPGASAFQNAIACFRSFKERSATPSPLTPLPSTAPSGAALSSVCRVLKSCPEESKAGAARAALAMQAVSVDSAAARELENLNSLAMANTPSGEIRAAVDRCSASVQNLIFSDISHVEPGAYSLQVSLHAAFVARACNKDARELLRASEATLVPSTVVADPSVDTFTKHIASGQIMNISEFILTGESNAMKAKLFAGGDSELDKSKAIDKVSLIFEALGQCHPHLAPSAKIASLNFKLLAKHALELRQPMSSVFDLVWKPFAKDFSLLALRARETPNAAIPIIKHEMLSPRGELAHRLFSSLLNSLAARKPLQQLAPAAAAPAGAAGNGTQPPPGTVATWNPAFPSLPGYKALPEASKREPHHPKVSWPCRNWSKGRCSFAHHCKFQHPGYS